MSSLSSFLVYPARKEVPNEKNEPHPLKIRRLGIRSSASIKAGHQAIALDGGTLSGTLNVS